jgi:DNA-binding NtrC family response regulator
MVRPCFLVIDREFPGSISSRKLVIETAKFNVITAYSAYEAVETLQQFPAIDGAVIDEDIHGVPCNKLIKELRQIKPGLRVIVISGPDGAVCPEADFHVESLDPRKLLETLQRLNPEDVEAIEQHEERLYKRERRAKPNE